MNDERLMSICTNCETRFELTLRAKHRAMSDEERQQLARGWWFNTQGALVGVLCPECKAKHKEGDEKANK